MREPTPDARSTDAPEADPPEGESELSPAVGHRRLSAELRGLLASLDGRDITLGEIVDSIGERGFGLLLMFLALPAALPVPAPGYATPFGLLMAGLGVQMILRREQPTLPGMARRRKVSHRKFAVTVRGAGLPLKLAELVVRPRLGALARRPLMRSLLGAIVVAMSLFMMLPVPLTNTAPSFVIFVLACGLLEEDGLLLAGSVLLAPVAAGIAGLAVYFAWSYGVEALDEGLRPLLERLLG